ncbi:hypothetical protein, partial [Prauserella aidingensis]|uniref:hypothetical protein n=1 Tax=Prauserella aidingensis TaxID=387890 RepID=UPI0020A2F83D
IQSSHLLAEECAAGGQVRRNGTGWECTTIDSGGTAEPGTISNGGDRSYDFSAGTGETAKDASGAESAVAGRNLGRQLASEQQMSEAGRSLAGTGSRVELRASDRLARQYGGDPRDWAKMGSTWSRGRDGLQFETHWYENARSGLRTEFKTKFWWMS